jgi:WD40 repeat protein
MEGRPAHEKSVEKVAFFNGPKKHLLCSCGADGMIRVWDSIDGTLASEVREPG